MAQPPVPGVKAWAEPRSSGDQMDTIQYGNSKQHLLRKLKSAGRDDLVGAVERGEVTAYQAANEAGHRTRKRPLEVDTDRARRREFRRHPDRVRCDAEMWYGPGHSASAFDSVERARCYWIANRARLMPLLAVDGRRPWGWWRFDAGDLRHPGRDRERSTLFEAGLLGAEEAAELLADWRREFDRGHGPNFFHCASGKILRGEAARREHFRWADIPPALVDEWSAEHAARARPDGRDQATATAGRCVHESP
jgi:hypothetical protein